jgi:hypothetical protein
MGLALMEYIELQRNFMPRISFDIHFTEDHGPVYLDIQGPPAYVQVLGDRLNMRPNSESAL